MTQRHQCFQIQTPAGAQAKIHGDPDMLPETRRALAELIDAVAKANRLLPDMCPGCCAVFIENGLASPTIEICQGCRFREIGKAKQL